MSRNVASLIVGLINISTSPLSPRQRLKSIARVAQTLERSSVRTVNTPRGDLKLHTLRGSGTASGFQRFGQDEPETLEWIDKWIKPNETLWDIGAHVGWYSLYAGMKESVTVYSFEPSALNFGLLVEHIALNDLGNKINPLCVALGKKTGIEKLHMSTMETGHACNAIGKSENQFRSFTPEFSQSVPVFSIDEFCKIFQISAPNHIKLDVDSIEEIILRGAKETLPKVTTVIVEIEGRNAENADNGIVSVLKAAGFEEELGFREKGFDRNRLYINKNK